MLLLKPFHEMRAMNDLDYITATLEQLSASDTDITPAVYERFFAASPAAAALFSSAEAQAVQGKMINELVQTVIDRLEQKPYSETVVETMVDDHDSWGATLPMYDAFLAAFLGAMQDVLGDSADPAAMAVWQRELAALREQIAGKLA
jgi:hemoglobin-like flavoprotein